MRKTIVLSICSIMATLFSSQAQTATSQTFFQPTQTSTSFNFKTASASILTKENALMNNYNYGSGTKSKAYLEQKVKKYHKMKIAGIVLASLGGAALVGTVAGSVVLGRRVNLYEDDGTSFLRTYGMAVGGTFLTAALLGPGIPLAIIGSKKEKRYKAQLAQK
ncbi:MAG: hypothetical protein KA174_11880 [Chitinophagales bacterium]|nr:hypothetical protein [Chitinophagales bacterium]